MIANVGTRPSIVGMPCRRQLSGRPARNRSPSARSCVRDELPADLVEVVDRRDEAGEQLVRERSRLVAVADRERVGGAHLVRPPRLEQLEPAEGEPEMRAVELVRRAEQHVDAGRLHVDRPVRAVVHGVDPRERAGFVRERRDLGDGRDRADRVRGPRERDDARAVGKQRRQVLEVEPALVVDLREADGQAAVARELEPRRHVAVVVEPRADDLVAHLPLA